MKADFNLVKVDTTEGFKALESEWNQLYEKAEKSTVFSSWDWMFTWWEIFHNEFSRELYILCLYNNDELVGIAPFHTNKQYPKSYIQGKTLQFISTGSLKDEDVTSEYLDFITLPSVEEEMVNAVSAYLEENRKDWSFADFDYLLEDSLITRCFSRKTKISKRVLENGVRFSVSPDQEFTDYQAKMGKRWRKMLDKKMRILERDGNIRIVTTNSSELLEPTISLFRDMHCARLKKVVGYCAYDSDKFASFHQKIIERLSPQKKAIIKILYLGDEPIASYYIFSDKGQWHYYQSGFKAEYGNKYSPLFLLICKEIERSIEEDTLFDFMYEPSVESYKRYQYAAESEPMVRLYWSNTSSRLFFFDCAKYLQEKAIYWKANALNFREKT